MSWLDQIKGDSLSWLLEPESPDVRYLALRDLLDRPETDPDLCAARKMAHEEGAIATVLSNINSDGYWVKPGPGYNPKYRSTVWSIILLAQLGASVQEDPRVKKACDYILDHNLTEGGQFTVSGAPSGTVDCLQGNLCWSLCELGCKDPRLAKAFDWMSRSVTGEGIAPLDNRQAIVRYYAYKCGPSFACGANNKLPCAWGANKVMLALSKAKKEYDTPIVERAIQIGIDFFFSVDPADAAYPSGYSSKPNQSWWKFGFPTFYVADVLHVVEGLVAVGCRDDPRLARAKELILEKQDAQGRWALEHDYKGKTWGDYGAKNQPNKFVTLRAMRVLKALGSDS
jgi:hypothetical protein